MSRRWLNGSPAGRATWQVQDRAPPLPQGPYEYGSGSPLPCRHSVFFCSTLVWYPVFTALNLSLDDNPTTARLLPYSPKRLLESPHVEVLYGKDDPY